MRVYLIVIENDFLHFVKHRNETFVRNTSCIHNIETYVNAKQTDSTTLIQGDKRCFPGN